MGPDANDPLIGLMLSGYLVKRPLGAGGMGTVYLCEHPDIGRLAAAKVLKADMASNADWAARFIREAKVMATLKQRNIVDIINFGTLPDGRSYVLMEYLDGESLRARLDRDGPLPISVALQFTEQVLSGLGVAHDVGVVHRDLKPENVFLVAEPNGETLLKLIDFGLARIDDQAPDTQGAAVPRERLGSLYAGTPEYLSPEQALQEPVGPAADLYAVGVILFEMIAGKLPFEGNVAQLLQQHASAIPPSLGDVVDGVPDGLTSLVRRLLGKEPSQRPRTAQLVRQEVMRVQKAIQAAGTQVRRIEPEASAPTRKLEAHQAPKRRRMPWLVVPAALAVLGAALAVSRGGAPAPRPVEPLAAVALRPVELAPAPLPRALEPVSSPEPAAETPIPPVVPPTVKGPARSSDIRACQDLYARREAMLERFDATKTALRARLAEKPTAERDAALKRADDVRTRLRTANTPAACRLATTGFERWLESLE